MFDLLAMTFVWLITFQMFSAYFGNSMEVKQTSMITASTEQSVSNTNIKNLNKM